MVVWEQATRIDLEKDEMFSRSYWKIGIIGRIQFGNLCLQQVLQDRSFVEEYRRVAILNGSAMRGSLVRGVLISVMIFQVRTVRLSSR